MSTLDMHAKTAAAVIVTIVSAHGQQSAVDSFRLEDYRHVSFSERALTVWSSANLFGSDYGVSPDDNNSMDESASLRIGHWISRHTPVLEYQGSHSLSLGGGGSVDDRVENDPYYWQSRQRANSFRAEVSISERAKRYLVGPFYLGGVCSAWDSQRPVEIFLDDQRRIVPFGNTDSAAAHGYRTETRHSGSDIGGSLQVMCGLGGITNATYAAVALNMLDRVAAVKGERPAVTRNQIERFARYLEVRKWKRVLDSREGLIEDIDSLSAWLVREKITDSENARQTMELLDQWQYGFNQQRLAGMEGRLFVDGYVRWYDHEGTTTHWQWDSLIANSPGAERVFPDNFPGVYEATNSSDDTHSWFSLGVSGNYAKLWGRFWQLNANAEGSGAILRQFSSAASSDGYSVESETVLPSLGLRGSVGIAWYPNTRTTCKAGLSLSYQRRFDYLTNEERDLLSPDSTYTLPLRNDFRAAWGNLSLTAAYYLSRHFTFTLSAGAGYSDTYTFGLDTPEHHSWSYNLSGGLLGKIF